MISWNPETGETFKGPTPQGPWTPISREEFDIRYERREDPLPIEWSPECGPPPGQCGPPPGQCGPPPGQCGPPHGQYGQPGEEMPWFRS